MNNNTELILIRITGLDRPGLTASITEILSKYDVTILDIGQADIHSTLSLGILFKSQEKDSGNIMKELLFKASALGINIRFYPVTVEEYEEWVNMQGKNRYILTLLGRKLTAKQIAAVTGILAEQGLNIDAIKRLTGRIPLDERKANVRACIEFSVRGTPHQREEMQQALMKLSSDLEMDFSFQLDNMYNFRANIAVLMNITPDHLDRYDHCMQKLCGRQIPHHPKPDTGRRFYLLERRPHHQARAGQAWPARPSLPVRCRQGRRGHRIRGRR